MTWLLAVQLCASVAAVGIVLDSAEMLASRQVITARFSWPVLRTTLSAPATVPPVSLALAAIARPGGMTAFQCSRMWLALASAVLWFYNLSVSAALCAALVAVAQYLGSTRLGFGLDGSDQMQTIIWAGLAMAGASPQAGLFLIAGQALLAYWIAGLAKLAGPSWRTGAAPANIATTVAHGSARGAVLLGHFSGAAAFATIAFEVVGPFLVFTGFWGGLIFVTCAAAFHLAIAAAMGLNNFVWAFGAALPPVLWLADCLPTS